jgi:hypothetical protein
MLSAATTEGEVSGLDRWNDTTVLGGSIVNCIACCSVDSLLYYYHTEQKLLPSAPSSYPIPFHPISSHIIPRHTISYRPTCLLTVCEP